MSKIFQRNQGPEVNVKRNTFDLSYASHLTGKLGKWIPCFCQEVLPGDSFQIDPKFGLRFNPLQFPIQTKMHAVMHFWYVRNRNLWKNWPEYITKTKDGLVHPYLDITESNAASLIGTGSIGDYLGVPSTITGDFARTLNCQLDTVLAAEPATASTSGRGNVTSTSGRPFSGTALEVVNGLMPTNFSVLKGATNATLLRDFNAGIYHKLGNILSTDATLVNYDTTDYRYFYGYWSKTQVTMPLKSGEKVIVTGGTYGSPGDLSADAGNVYLVVALGERVDTPFADASLVGLFGVSMTTKTSGVAEVTDIADTFYSLINDHMGTNSVYVGIVFDADTSKASDNAEWQTLAVLPTASTFVKVGDYLHLQAEHVGVIDATDPTVIASNPFVRHAGETTPKIKINALPFRAYESVYRAGYQDQIVDPFILDGQPVYNKFVTNDNDGADSTDYHLFDRYWERDYYTSMTNTPQMGIAPLVGISATGEFTFSDGENTYTAQATIGDDNETITGISTYSPDMPKGSLRQLMDVVTNGISINDLRNVNSLQRFLESSLRRGYQYVDQIYTHFGVKPGYKANDMPDFLGGIHVTADVNQINDTGTNLGDYAGQMSIFGGTDNKISKYCDENGYIIGVCACFPEPCYSQMLPKYFTKTMTALDYYFPEFGHIGMQPVTYNEVCPVEVANYDLAHSTDTINDTFGYQRAWGDYLANTDQVHGDFRTNLSNFVVSRVFNGKPELGHDFISINNDEIDDVFVVTDDSDKMLGELRFSVRAQRPIPMYGVPSLE